MTIPATSVKVSGRNTKPSGDRRTAVRTRRSCVPATPSPRSSGEIDIPEAGETAQQRDAGERVSGRFGISPSTSEPSRPANAKNRSLAITTPSGLAIPPSSGSAAESARARMAARGALCTSKRCRTALPPGKGRGGLFHLARGTKTATPAKPAWPLGGIASDALALPAAATEEAEEQEDEHDDQDYPEEKTHAGHPLSGFRLSFHTCAVPKRPEGDAEPQNAARDNEEKEPRSRSSFSVGDDEAAVTDEPDGSSAAARATSRHAGRCARPARRRCGSGSPTRPARRRRPRSRRRTA